jgi:hypothetical protein
MGMSWVWVDRKFDPKKIIVELNLTLKPAPMGEISHSNPSDFVNGHFLLGFFSGFEFIEFFQVLQELNESTNFNFCFFSGFE